MRATILVAFWLFAMPSLTACGGPSTDVDEALPSDESAATPAPLTILPAGSVLPAGAASIEILKVVERDGPFGYEFRRPSSGAVFVLVEYRVANVSSEQIRFDDAPEPQLIDASGRVVLPDPSLTLSLRAGSLSYANPPTFVSPGVGVKSAVAFEVSRSAFNRRDWLIGLDRGARSRLPPAPVAARPAPLSDAEGDEIANEALKDRLADDAAASGLTTVEPPPAN